jgi:hypothetical protein
MPSPYRNSKVNHLNPDRHIQSKVATPKFRDEWDRIFGKKEEKHEEKNDGDATAETR